MRDAISSSIPINLITMFIPVLFLYLGMTSNIEQVKKFKNDKKSLLTGLVIQLFFVPLIGFAISQIYSDSLLSLSVLIVLITPGGHISSYFSHIKNANVPLSVFLTSITSLMSPLTIPIWLRLSSTNIQDYEVEFLELFLQLCLAIILPYFLGIIIKSRFVRIYEFTNEPLDRFLKFVIVLVSIWTPIELRTYISEYFIESFLFTVAILLCIYIGVNQSTKLLNLENNNSNTLKIEAVCQNFPIVLALSLTLNAPLVAIFGITYYCVSFISVAIFSFTKIN